MENYIILGIAVIIIIFILCKKSTQQKKLYAKIPRYNCVNVCSNDCMFADKQICDKCISDCERWNRQTN